MLNLIIFSLAAVQVQFALAQCINRQANIVFNRPDAVIEAPVAPVVQPTVIEDNNFLTPTLTANPTTIITDCTPSVCKNLVNTIQLMIVCNLLSNSKGGPDLAAQITSPIIKEMMTTPAFSCGCSNPLANLPPNLISSALFPNLITSPNFFSGLPGALPLQNVNMNALLGNIVGKFR